MDYIYSIEKIWGARAAGARLIQESEVTTAKIGLFKMVKMQKCAPAARGARQNARLNARQKTWDI